MIDIHKETVLSLTDAGKHLPRRRAGKRPHVATLYRWAQHGVRGVILETIQVGGTLCTSLEALQRFCERCTSGDTTVALRTAGTCRRQVKAAELELDAAGI